jgi:2-haloacid dehalogenase
LHSSAELARHYKPDPKPSTALLGLPPSAVLMVAAHPSDLQAAARVGFQTAYVPRPLEHGPGRAAPAAPPDVSLVADDFRGLAAQLGV